MRKFLAAFILMTVLAYAAPSKNEFKPQQHAAMHYIYMGDIEQKDADAGFCTAVAIAPHTLLTAEHCDYKKENGILKVDDELTVVGKKYYDGYEHMILYVPAENFKVFVEYNPSTYRPPVVGEHVFMFGNPRDFRDLYREGYMGGYDKNPEFEDGISVKAIALLFMIPVGPGDSGAAIYSETDNRLVAILTGSGGPVAICFPLKFTQKQVDEAKGK